MVEYQQFGFAQTVAKLAEVLLQHECLTSAGISFLFSAELQVCRLRRGVDFTSAGTGLITGKAGLQQRLVTGFSRRTALTGDQRLRADLRRLHAVPGPARMVTMFGGCMLMALAVACIGLQVGVVEPFPAANSTWIVTGLLLAGVLMLGNWALQFGAARLAAGSNDHTGMRAAIAAPIAAWLASIEPQPRLPLGLV